jgi:transcriptional regulator with XRE-family HTH domain
MNFTQTHERLRLELLRRMQRGTLSVSLLARQSGLSQVHLSNFLHSKRQLSLEALDRVLAVQHLTVADLVPMVYLASDLAGDERIAVPIVSHSAALFEPYIRVIPGQETLPVPGGILQSLRARPTAPRRAWQRFVAVRTQATDVQPMEPLILAEAIVVIDRHYNSLAPYRPNRPNLYAVRHEAHIVIRFVELLVDRVVLRPQNAAFPLEMVDSEPGKHPGEMIAGRVALIVNEA